MTVSRSLKIALLGAIYATLCALVHGDNGPILSFNHSQSDTIHITKRLPVLGLQSFAWITHVNINPHLLSHTSCQTSGLFASATSIGLSSPV